MTPYLIVGRRSCCARANRKHRAMLVMLAMLAFVPVASAQQAAPQTPRPQEDPNVVAAARALAVEGVKLARDRRCDEATDKLERAEQLRHSAIVLSQLGECYVTQGRFVEGAEAMRSVLREGLGENPSDAMKAAYAAARAQLETAKSKIATLTIELESVAGAQAEVTIDGQSIPQALIGAPRPTDPGEHTIEATAPGFLPAKRRVTLKPGEIDSVTLALVVGPASAQATPKPAAEPPTSAAPASSATEALSPEPAAAASGPNRLPAYIAWGVGAAGLAVGVAYGWVAMEQKSDLDRVCPAERCPPEQSARLDAAKANGVISSVAIGVSISAAVLGGVLFLLADGDAEAPPNAARASAAGARLGFDGTTLEVKF